MRGKKTPLPDNALEAVVFDLERATKVLTALAHPSRYQMICLLREKDWPSLSLTSAVGLTPGAGSQHLVILKAAGLVATRRAAQTIYYSLKAKEISPILDILESSGSW